MIEKKRRFFFTLSPLTTCQILRVESASRIVILVLDSWPQFNLEGISLLLTHVIDMQSIALQLFQIGLIGNFKTPVILRKTITSDICFQL